MSTSAKNTQLATITENDPRWASVVARDPQPPLKFYYSVKTTGVYCCAPQKTSSEAKGRSGNVR
jgi:AraC family transcriptional regulator, regulatory protein of adaptative response / methylated-DNA-[protein]-cysteine methyltransferase